MFEIPEDDTFWDDFPLEDDTISCVDKELIVSDESSSVAAAGASFLPRDKPGSGDANKDGFSRTTDFLTTNTTISSTKTFHVKRSERKFPGPAGLLPLSPSSANFNHGCVPEITGTSLASASKGPPTDELCSLPPSQPQVEDVFNFPPWRKMLDDLGDDHNTFLNKFSIKALLLRASRKMLHKGKVPLVFGVLDHVDMQGSDASFVIRDETGKMKGSLHKDLIYDPSTALQAGCALILRQVSVISPSARTHYLNVTPANIVFVYSLKQEKQESGVTKRSWQAPDSPSVNSVGSPSLREIIEESERELSASLRNFHNRRSHGLPSSSPVASSINITHLGYPHPSQNLGSPSLFSLNSGQTAVPHRGLPRQGFQPRTMRPPANPVPPRVPGFRGYAPALRPRHSSLSESPLPPRPAANPAQSVRQPSPAVLPPRLAETRGSMISGDVAVRQSRNNVSTNSSSVSANSVRQSTNNVSTNSGNVSANSGKFQANICNDDMADSFGCDFDFPEDDVDTELLQMCDATLVDSENLPQSGRSESDPFGQFRLGCQPERASPLRVTSNVISKMFKECYDENSDSLKKSDLNRPLSSIQTKSTSGKSFTFKRSFASSPAMSDVSSMKRKFPLDSSIPLVNFKNPTNQSVSPGLPVLQDTLQAPKRSMFDLTATSGQRDARVQLGQAGGSNLQTMGSHQMDALAHWDDDLNDDLLLSQLSEEF